jgi:hypothetical protein
LFGRHYVWKIKKYSSYKIYLNNVDIIHKGLVLKPGPTDSSKIRPLKIWFNFFFNSKGQISQKSDLIFKKYALLTRFLSNRVLTRSFPALIRSFSDHYFNILYCILIILKKIKKTEKIKKLPRQKNII